MRWLAWLLGGCGPVLLPPTPEQVAAAQARSPGVTFGDLEVGRLLAVEHCAGCHALPRPTRKEPDEWSEVLELMGRKAKLSGEEESAVLAYLQAVAVE